MHCKDFMYFTENTSTEVMKREVFSTIAHSGDGYGTETINFIYETFDCEEDALEYIRSIDKDFYGGYAVKFHNLHGICNSKIEKIVERKQKIYAQQKEYIEKNKIQNRTSEFIGCPNCKSKLNKSKIYGQLCPLCRTDLRSATVKNKIASYDEKIISLDTKILEEKKKLKGKGKIEWIVKYEYHC